MALLAHAPSDTAVATRLLPQVSRTFALSIEMLPDELRDAVRVGYLLCRLVDTIEDEPGLSPIVRVGLFDAFDAALESDDVSCEPLLRLRHHVVHASEAEAELLLHADAMFREFRRLPALQREAIRPHVLEMSAGMREYALRADRDGRLRMGDSADLERYCYFVAGTVGHLLTSLFVQTVPDMSRRARALVRSHATSFGVGLQLVNIAKDVAEDHERGVCFLPEDALRRRGLHVGALLDSHKRDDALAVLGEVCARAHVHLARAAEYVGAWPVDAGADVRTFCLVPLALALATLAEVELGPDALRAGVSPKVPRALVARVVDEAVRGARDEDAAVRLLDLARAWRVQEGACPRP